MAIGRTNRRDGNSRIERKESDQAAKRKIVFKKRDDFPHCHSWAMH
jgi:hypothetical protein